MNIFKHYFRRTYQDPLERIYRLGQDIRLLAFVVAAGILFTGVQLQLYPSNYKLGVVAVLAYPLLMQALITASQSRKRMAGFIAATMMPLDAIVIGMTGALLHFAVIPSLVLLIIVHANTLNHGSLRMWLLNMLLACGSAGLASLWLDVPMAATITSLPLAVLSVIGLGLYVGAGSLYAHRQTVFLHQVQTRVREQQQQAVDLSRKLAKYLPPQIWGSLFSGKRDAKLETRRKRLTVFFSDIKGFSAISEELPLETLTRMLNTYLNDMTRIALRHGGTIDKFIGDAIMVFFGDPKSEGAQEDAYRCAAMAIEMQQHMRLLRQRWHREGITQKLEIRIGINTGYVTVGNFGTESRMDYTILGTDVNLASRLESVCRPGQVLVSKTTFDLIQDRIRCRNVGEVEVKGFKDPLPIFEAQDLKRNAGDKQRFVSVATTGFGLHIDLERIHNFDKNRILKALARSASNLKKQQAVATDFETEGFALHLHSDILAESEREKVSRVMGKAAGKIQEQVKV